MGVAVALLRRGCSMGIPTGKALNTTSPSPSSTLYIIKPCLEALEDRAKIIIRCIWFQILYNTRGWFHSGLVRFSYFSLRDKSHHGHNSLGGGGNINKNLDQLKNDFKTLMGRWGLDRCKAVRKEEPPLYWFKHYAHVQMHNYIKHKCCEGRPLWSSASFKTQKYLRISACPKDYAYFSSWQLKDGGGRVQFFKKRRQSSISHR